MMEMTNPLNPFNVKMDCFGMDEEYGVCFVLKETFCRNGKDCPFYKSKDVENSELMQYNNVDDLELAIRNYASTHEGK